MAKPSALDLPTAHALETEQQARMAPVVEVPRVFTAAECAQIVALRDTLGFDDAPMPAYNQPAEGSKRTHEVDHSRRHTERTHLLANSSHAWIYDRVAAATSQVNDRAWHFRIAFIEPLQLLGYPVGGNIDWHSDLGDRGLTSLRKVSATILLSDPASYEGGQLEVLNGGRVVVPGRAIGQAIFFPSFQNHRVTPVTRGVRHALIVWTIGKHSLA